MNKTTYDTLADATSELIKNGYIENFSAKQDAIVGSITKKQYQPQQLKIIKTYCFEGDTYPQDDALVFAIKAVDGQKGTLVMSYSAKHNQNVELIKKIPKA